MRRLFSAPSRDRRPQQQPKSKSINNPTTTTRRRRRRKLTHKLDPICVFLFPPHTVRCLSFIYVGQNPIRGNKLDSQRIVTPTYSIITLPRETIEFHLRRKTNNNNNTERQDFRLFCQLKNNQSRRAAHSALPLSGPSNLARVLLLLLPKS